MKRLIIAEEEKRRILGLYTRFLINEQSNEDIEFNTWLISEFPSVASKYGISTPSTKIDSNTLYKIKNESATMANFPIPVVVGKRWDIYKSNKQYLGQTTKKAQEDAEIKKREQLYAQKQAIRNVENERLEKQGFTVKRDVLDPKNIMGSSAYNKIEWCKYWHVKYPNKPCVVEGEKLLEGDDIPVWVDWLVTVLEWLFPQFSFIKKIYDIGVSIFYFVKAKGMEAQDAVNAAINYIYGIAQMLKVFNITIVIPGMNKITKNVYNYLNSKEFGSILTNLNVAFKNAPKWLQALSVIIGKLGGDKIAEIIINIITAILYPIQNVIEYISPTTAQYIKNFAEFLKGLGNILVQGGKLVNDSPKLKQIIVPN